MSDSIKLSFSRFITNFVDMNLNFSLRSLRLCGELDFFQGSHSWLKISPLFRGLCKREFYDACA